MAGTGILSGDFVVPKAGSPASELHFDSQTEATRVASFPAKKFLRNLLAGTGIEPATQGFSVLCSTD